MGGVACTDATDVIQQVNATFVPDGVRCCHMFLGVVI